MAASNGVPADGRAERREDFQGSETHAERDRMEEAQIEHLARLLRADGQFGPLSTDQIADVLRQSRQLSARPGEIIYKEDDAEAAARRCQIR